jgi:ankyrin repeat protein
MDMIDALVSAYTRWHQNVSGDVSYEWALILACQRNNTDLAKKLLQAGADPNVYCGYGRLAANIAVRNGNRRLLQLLLDAGASPIMGYPEPDPLIEAVAKGDAECVRLLLSYDTSKIMKREPKYGSYLLWQMNPTESVRRLLLDAGADPKLGPPDMTRAYRFK